MFEKLEKVEERYDRMQRDLCDPSVASDIARVTALSKEIKNIEPAVSAYREYKKACAELSELKELMDSPDKELSEIACSEYDEKKDEIPQLEQKLRMLLIPKDPNDDRSVIVEIRAGTGGEESALFAHSLFRMYTMYAETKGFKTEILNANETQLGGCKEISFEVSGQGAYSRFKFESGVHRVQRVPETESQGRIQTSAATVAVLPESDAVELDIDPKDIQIDTFRSSGAGGQKVNKTSSAIRVTYLPTGLVVECQDERSQYKNKDRALKILYSRLLDEKQAEHDEKIAGARREMVKSGDRSERIRTYNFPQGRVTDHRIGLTLYKIDAIMDGDLDELIDALITADTAEKLKADL
jgi:peptide chain release factor 1